MKKLLQEYGTEEKSSDMGMVILEFAALTGGIKKIAETCYILKGGSAIILRAGEVFKKIEHVIDNNYK